jgi:hypothetical protein
MLAAVLLQDAINQLSDTLSRIAVQAKLEATGTVSPTQ